MERKDSSAEREANLRLAAGVSEWAEEMRRAKTTTAQRAPVGGRMVGDPPGRGEIPGTPISNAPTREHVPTPDAARGRPSTWSPAAESMDQTYQVIAASTVLAAKLGRPEMDLRAMLREEIAREFAGGAYDFRDALLRAQRQIEADVRGGRR